MKKDIHWKNGKAVRSKSFRADLVVSDMIFDQRMEKEMKKEKQLRNKKIL